MSKKPKGKKGHSKLTVASLIKDIYLRKKIWFDKKAPTGCFFHCIIEVQKAPEGDKVSTDEGKKSDADNKNAETDKKSKPEKKQSRKKKKAAKKAEG